MHELDDTALLRQYAEQNSEEAFATLVTRHIDKVYSVALRHTGNPHSAEEITQAVFVILARKSHRLSKHVMLEGWLYETARLTAMTYIRSKIRRARREQEAYMQNVLNENEADVWPQIAPLLDSGLAGLNETDRHAVVLRFFYGKSMKEIGTVLGGSEDTARMRVNRALEKLRKFFTKRGIASTAATLAGTISANSVQAAPVALAKSVTAVAIAKGAAASGSTLTLIKGALKIMAWSKAKIVVVAGTVVLLATTTATTLVFQHQHQTRLQPRTSWAFTGYANPQSALMSYLWTSVCQADRQVFEISLTPAQQLIYERMINMNMKVPQLHSEDDTVAEIFKRASEQWQDGSYRILDRQVVSSDQVILHLFVKNSKQNKDVFVKMKKIGNEWKYDGFKQ